MTWRSGRRSPSPRPWRWLIREALFLLAAFILTPSAIVYTMLLLMELLLVTLAFGDQPPAGVSALLELAWAQVPEGEFSGSEAEDVVLGIMARFAGVLYVLSLPLRALLPTPSEPSLRHDALTLAVLTAVAVALGAAVALVWPDPAGDARDLAVMLPLIAGIAWALALPYLWVRDRIRRWWRDGST